MRGRGLLCREAPSLALPPQETGVGRRWGRGRFSKRSASPQTPSPEEWLGIGLSVLLELCAHASWVRFPVYWLSPRQLTEPPRTCGVGDEPPPPAYGGHLSFQGRLCVEVCPKGSLRGSMRGAAAKLPQVTVSCPLGMTKGLCDRPLETFARTPSSNIWYPTLAGRGGSVSRRDHNPAAGTRDPPPRRNQARRTVPTQTPAALRERGVWGRGASLREAASPPESPHHPTSLEEGARGRGLFYRKGPSLGILRSTLGSFEIYIVALVVLGELRYNEGV